MKTLIVTGGTGGLGTVVVERLAHEYRCVLLYKDAAPSAAGVESIRADISDESAVRLAMSEAAERHGPPYGLVHLAGGFAGGVVSATTLETWQSMINLNLTSSFLVIRGILEVMSRDAPGRIIAISSEATLAKPAASAAYTVSKSGLNLLIELTARELAGTAITANALLPTSLATPAMRRSDPEGTLVPLERVSDTIAFLLSDAASSISGALIPLRS